MNTTALEGLDAPARRGNGVSAEPVVIDELGPMERISETFRKAALLSGLHGHAPHDDCRDRRGASSRTSRRCLATVSAGMMHDRPNERLPDNRTWPRAVRPGPEAPAMNAQTGGLASEPPFVQPPVDG